MNKLRRWLLKGPDKSDGTLGWMLGNMIHWRMIVSTVLAALPIAVGVVALNHVSPFYAVCATAMTALVIEPKAMKVSPKYTVTENY